ncbi:MAG: murein biosynthesis integral membrane protein MurJ [Bacillota bacterium]|nr:murein biosynthesis integral membrane protein MurJ [Bacillota bacterium]
MTKNIIKAAGVLLLINIVVKLLGFVREVVIASGFGASALSDAYKVAYTLPYFMQAVLGYAFVSAVLPALSHYWSEGEDNSEAHHLASSLLNITALLLLPLSLLGVAAAPFLVWLTAPNLPADTAQLAAQLTRIIFPSMLFMGVGMVMSGILNSRYRFVAAALAPAVTSIAVIVTVQWLCGSNVYALAWATLAGFAGFMLLQMADLPRTGFKYRLCLDLRHPVIKKVLENILPIVLGLAVTQIYTIINRIFASSLAEGSIAALDYAGKMMNLPLGVFVAAIITAAFPALAELADRQDTGQLAATVRKGLSMIALVAIPAALGLMILDTPIIRLLFERGSFDAADTVITAQALLTLAPGLVFLAASMLLIRVYYALSDVKTPMLTGAVSIAANTIASLLLVGPMGLGGLGLANTLAAAVNTLLLWYFLQKRLDFCSRGAESLYRELGKTLAASLLMAVPVAAAQALLPHVSYKYDLTAQLLGLIAAAVLIYVLILLLLKSATLKTIAREFKRK